MEFVDDLVGLGFTRGESKTYLSLLKLGSSSAKNIISISGMQNSAVHLCLNNLIKKGYVSFVLNGNRRVYSPVSPKEISERLEKKKKLADSIISKLSSFSNLQESFPFVKIFVGARGVFGLLNSLLEDSRRGDDYMFFGISPNDLNEKVDILFAQHSNKRKEIGLKVRGIVPLDLKSLYKGSKLNLKFSSAPLPVGLTIVDNSIAMFDFQGNSFIGFLINCKSLADSYREFFEATWNSLK